MRNKTFDPRGDRLMNPFVQAFVEKQAGKAKPISDRQKVVNILFGAVLLNNMLALMLVIYSARSSIIPELAGDNRQNASMGEAMAKIRMLELSLQTMRTSVEYHKNAYFKIEQEHESMKAALARVVPAGGGNDILTPYTTPVSMNAAQAHDRAVAAQLNSQINGQ